MFWIKILAVLLVALLLLKRSIRGPQLWFARTAVAATAGGIGALSLARAQGDYWSWVGALLIMAGLLLALSMVLADLTWMVQHMSEARRTK